MPGKTKNYTDDFKLQIVNLRKSGKTVSSISEEYGIAKSTINKWVADFKNSGVNVNMEVHKSSNIKM